MGYIDANLLDGEQVIYRAKRHWMVFFRSTVWAFLAFIFISSGSSGTGAFLVLLTIIDAIAALLEYKTSEFGLTNRRVLIKVGFIRRKSLETLLPKVEGIQVDQGLFGRMFNYGTIIITGTGGTQSPFEKISNPFEFRKKVQEQISLPQKA